MPTQRDRNAVQAAARIVPREQSRRFAIRLAFDGTTYQGFQSQPYQNTIQDQLEHRLRGLLKRKVRVVAWGRTDAGVHAKGAVVTVDLGLDEMEKLAKRSSTEGSVEVKAAAFLHSVLMQFACNSGETPMPQTRYGSISARAVVPVPSNFDARYSAIRKRYVYYVCASGGVDNHPLPFLWTRYAWHIKQLLYFDMMLKASELIDGEHNFEWMSVVQQGELRESRRRVQLRVETVPMQGDADGTPFFLLQPETSALYKITCTCDFFLYKMMRRIVGVVVALGKGDASIDTLKSCLDAYDNADDASQERMPIPHKLLQTAPAKGLCLDHIEYDIPM